MRKETEKAVKAFLADKKMGSGNTTVVVEDNKTKLYLFGNQIAEKEGESIKITNAGYSTNTTKERLNGLLSEIGIDKRVSQKDYTWYLGNEVWNGSWTKIK